jgi:hypothetical protein
MAAEGRRGNRDACLVGRQRRSRGRANSVAIGGGADTSQCPMTLPGGRQIGDLPLATVGLMPQIFHFRKTSKTRLILIFDKLLVDKKLMRPGCAYA